MPSSLWPFWIAHRGAGDTAPENTLAALREGFERGWRMFEVDVTLTQDGQAVLMHDTTLERTTNGHGEVSTHTLAAIRQLDAGSWFNARYAAEPVPTLDQVLRFSEVTGCPINFELKPQPGQARETGTAVAKTVTRWLEDAKTRGNNVPRPLLTSFAIDALVGAKAHAPDIARGFLPSEPGPQWEQTVHALDCQMVIVEEKHVTPALLRRCQMLELSCLAYTVNDPLRAQELIDMGISGIITDAVDRMGPGSCANTPTRHGD